MHYIILSLACFSFLCADEAVCAKCQIIREHNAAHPENNYYWYEDYLKDQEVKKSGSKESELDKKIEKNILACSCNDKDRHRGRRE